MIKPQLNVIAHIYNGFNEKFGIPRQSGLVPEALSRIVFTKEFADREAIRGIEGFSHLWLIFEFSKNVQEKFSPTVRPPRLGGNKRMGVFATRSPFRPNGLGLSSVKLVDIIETEKEGTVLIVSGADILSGTPIVDIKPYVKYADSHPDAVSGFADEFAGYALNVEIDGELLNAIDESERTTVIKLLENDPRPSYQEGGRIYKMSYSRYDIAFTVSNGTLTVTELKNNTIDV